MKEIVQVTDLTIESVKLYSNKSGHIFIPRTTYCKAIVEEKIKASLSNGINGILFIEFEDGRSVAIKPKVS